MPQSAFLETEFFLLILFSLILPFGIYTFIMWKRAISRKTVFFLAIALIVLAGIDILLLQQLRRLAELTPSMLDNLFFVSELSVALYLLPALFAGIGINMVSHLLVSHLVDAERRFNREHEHPERCKVNDRLDFGELTRDFQCNRRIVLHEFTDFF